MPPRYCTVQTMWVLSVIRLHNQYSLRIVEDHVIFELIMSLLLEEFNDNGRHAISPNTNSLLKEVTSPAMFGKAYVIDKIMQSSGDVYDRDFKLFLSNAIQNV